ncbi:hypothetical protein STAS_25041 [Striga asiatica]|uniref:C2 NT-type domain-containing protein n=1 Tax=Striga asiatica TaxID=4170 RepID=A0A5A7QSQ2_STRAF|nr:hypothetical protein STAS_25041 [Striga asiatica]
MSRVSKWKLEKTKVKVVFRLQFHATHNALCLTFQIPQSGWDKLFISFIPTDSGKATAKTTKANVRNGTCKWADPIYETTRLLQDSKSKQYDEKLYKIVVAMGTSRASILGEATINLADYVDALKPSAATFPLHGCNFGTILHISIQLLTSKTGFREFEQQRELREKGIQSGQDSHAPGKIPSPGYVANYQDNKMSSPLEEEANPTEETDSATGFDASSNTSGSFYAERNETPSTHEIDNLNQNIERVGPAGESSLFDLKLEVSSLQSLADELGAETQRLSRQLITERSSAEQLAREVSIIKSECLEFRGEIVKLRDLKSSLCTNRTTDLQLQFPKGIAMVESKIRDLHSKTRLSSNGSDPKFICSELEVLLDFLLGLKLENGNGLGLDLCQPESILPNPADDIDAMRGQILDLVRELDESRVEKEDLIRKTNQMECYYEALVHELEENQKRLLGELQLLRNEHSACLYTLSIAKTEVDSLSHDLSQQMARSADERRELEALNEELERRAVTSETALKRARMNYSIAVDKLQEDLRLLSSQVTSMFEMNENLIKNALPARDVKRCSGGDIILLRDLRRSMRVQEEHYEIVERELTEMYSVNLELDLFSTALVESLREADNSIRIADDELKLSMASQNKLMMNLQKATDDIYALNEYKLSSVSRFNDLALQNKLLEDKLASAAEKNYLLAEKLKDLERGMMEYESYRSMYAACSAENAELSRHLEQKGSEIEKLANEILTLKEKLMNLKVESDELVSSKKNLEGSIDFVREKLANLLESYGTQFHFVDNFQNLDSESVDVKDAALRLEKIQLSVYTRYCELLEENQILENERAVADVSLSASRSEIVMTKEKFKSDLEDMVTRLDVSNALVGKLQAELESVDSKLRLSSEIEEKHISLNKVLMADLALLEDQMLELTCKNGHLVDEVSILDALAEEHERSELTISELMHDKQELSKSLQEKTEESTKLSGEISHLKETSKILHDELFMEKACRNELEGRVRDLSFQLNKAEDELLSLEQQKSELMHVRELASEHISEKSRLARLLDQQNMLIEDLKRNNSYHGVLESELLEMHEHLVATDVRLIYVANHYEAIIEGLLQKLVSSGSCLMELQKKYHETEAMLNEHLEGETNWSEEKLNLLTSLEASEAQNRILSDSNKETRHQLEECRNKLTMMIDAEQEIYDLAISNKEFEILVTVLESKIREQFANIKLLEGSKDQLSIKLSEQVLKTEEFKNLSTHLKELKDKAEAECLLVSGKRETEVGQVAPSPGQDSLRIAFMKEQYETQAQELKQQVSILRKHGEEMLLRLQDAIDEIENRKKSEAVNVKKNEELLIRFSALEEDLQSAVKEKCEKTNAYDRTKAELECALLSLECCKEEKEKLGSSLREFEAEKSRLASDLESVKAQLEDLKSSMRLVNGEKVDSTEPGQLRIIQEDAAFATNDKNLDVCHNNSGAQRLRSSMEHLHEELEKMKNENKADCISRDVDPDIQILQQEIMKLHKANEELGQMFPPFNEISAGDNALERVLALEIELAEALKSKRKSKVVFQSSFLKHHGDEEAIFKSFRDINELIKETLQLKERRAALEAELRDMHDRYSQLSLQFAEVEGDRQKLRMTLKNVRSSRKLPG